MSTNQGNTSATIDIRLAVDTHTTHLTPSVGTIQVGFNEMGGCTPICSSVILSKMDVIT
jgi:hypothetical protein